MEKTYVYRLEDLNYSSGIIPQIDIQISTIHTKIAAEICHCCRIQAHPKTTWKFKGPRITKHY